MKAYGSIQCPVLSVQNFLVKMAATIFLFFKLTLKMKYFLFSLLLLNTEYWTLNTVAARDLGTHGIIYPIEEQDPVQVIQQKLKAMEDSGDLERRNRELQKKAQASVERPKPVEGITRVSKTRVFYYDPTHVVQTDLKDHRGRIFAKKGTKLNPLETVSLSTKLIFFDGDDEEQLTWVKKQLTAQEKEDKIIKLILVRGAPLKLSEELGMPVYFDQSGILTKKLGIQHVPAFVSQDGQKLRIEEIKVPPSWELEVEGGL